MKTSRKRKKEEEGEGEEEGEEEGEGEGETGENPRTFQVFPILGTTFFEF